MNPPPKFVAIAFSDYGGIGFEFYLTVVRPYFEGPREKDEAAGGTGWPGPGDSDAARSGKNLKFRTESKSEFKFLQRGLQHHDNKG